ncbi:MAG TPA: hypothetical protein PKD54_04350, partial [Pirellulaceae bacterium]|nr:hypothetical protein [Pirellulaceae bacterium]
MNDDQRKAVMAKLGGGGGGGYSGGARGGGSPMRKQRAQFSRLSQEMELRRQGQTGLQSALTPVELLMSTGLEAGLDSLNQARESTDNRMIDLALGAAGNALVAAGFRNGLKNNNQAIAGKAAGTRQKIEAIIE